MSTGAARKFWQIYKHEYTRHVLRRRFIIALLSVPLWFVFAIGMGLLSIVLQTNRAPVGFVDQAGLLKIQNLPEESTPLFTRVPFQPFNNEQEARAALDAKKIQAYFVLPADYSTSHAARLIFHEEPADTVTNQFRNLLRVNLLADRPAEITRRVIDGPDLVVQATEEKRQTANNDWLKIAAPIAAGIFLMVSVFTSAGYLMQAVVEEKENRTMEMLVTSVSPEVIMSSKITALISVGLTQVLVWSVFPLVALLLVAANTPFLPGFSIDWRSILLMIGTALPTFVLVAALMATVGATVTEAREGQQVSSLITFPLMVPYMLAGVIVTNPASPISVFLSLFPLTASLTLLLRMAFSTVPTWQILTSAGLLIVSAVGMLWLSGRVFRAGMLRYGKRMSWKDVLHAALPRTASGNGGANGRGQKEAV